MGIWKLVRLKFGRCPAHFGELGIGIEQTHERVRSDTLFSAWLSAYARLADRTDVNSLVEKFQSDQPPFRLSSTFIYQTINDQVIDYLPHPLIAPIGYSTDDRILFSKQLKKLKYLPLEVWERWYQGNGFDEGDRQELLHQTPPASRTSLKSLGTFDYNEAFKINRVPKVSIDRITRATNFYHTGFVQYRWRSRSELSHEVESLSGLYFLVYFPNEDPELENTFFAVLDFLGGEGIGGERSSGAGQFKIDIHTAAQNLSPQWEKVVSYDKGDRYCLASLFWQKPLPDDLKNDARYELQERGGWITSPVSDGRQLRRKSVQMFTEGSVFGDRPSGNLADVTPENEEGHPKFRDHKIYRSGISLSLPINGQEAE